MTQLFNEQGEPVPVTVVQAGPCVVIQKKTKKDHGYDSICVGFEEMEEKKATKPMLGTFKKAGTKCFRYLKEFRPLKMEGFEIGKDLNVSLFKKGDNVDVSAVTKGKGYQGVIKRCGKAGGPAAHGSKFHRTTGSVGMRTWPGRILPGTGMAGQMGNAKRTTRNLRIVDVDAGKNLIFVKGGLPGSKNGLVVVSTKAL